ncbi:hypothetical protein AWB76_04808 [Caballeronia temeraria]|uniref:Uncharacterized protein n=1 Tax=Caballeronia temeraria TaxID=1777137 RepID=A0A158BX01_9BURK|nr:hypothetical protein AWB76_04808 [Caballeronia temeraria]
MGARKPALKMAIAAARWNDLSETQGYFALRAPTHRRPLQRSQATNGDPKRRARSHAAGTSAAISACKMAAACPGIRVFRQSAGAPVWCSGSLVGWNWRSRKWTRGMYGGSARGYLQPGAGLASWRERPVSTVWPVTDRIARAVLLLQRRRRTDRDFQSAPTARVERKGWLRRAPDSRRTLHPAKRPRAAGGAKTPNMSSRPSHWQSFNGPTDGRRATSSNVQPRAPGLVHSRRPLVEGRRQRVAAGPTIERVALRLG